MRKAWALALLAPIGPVLGNELQPHPWYDATGKHAGVYLCVPEISSGIRFDEPTKSWTYGHFATDGKSLVFTIKKDEKIKEDYVGTNYLAMTYTLEIGRLGEKSPRRCFSPDGSGHLFISDSNTVVCWAGSIDYKLSLKTMRFMEMHPVGYVDGIDAPANDLWITVGKCNRVQ